jgi:hypothetical protein
MKNWIIFSVILLSVSFPLTSFATDATASDCYTLSGWGTSAVNGTYTYYGAVDGYPGFIDDESEIYLRYYSGGPYLFLNAPPASGGTAYYYQDPGTHDYTGGGAWTVSSLGSAPTGTITLVTCPEEESSTEIGTSTASTTPGLVIDPSRDIFLGMFVFFGSFLSVVWLFKKQ